MKRLLWQPIESKREFVIAVLIFGICGLVWQVIRTIWLQGLGQPQPLADTPQILFCSVVVAPIREESFKGVGRLIGILNRDTGVITLTLLTVAWVVLHQFGEVTTPWRLIDDSLAGIFLFRLWRGRWWPWAYATHAGMNLVFILILQGMSWLWGK
jgi:hypothetical protein